MAYKGQPIPRGGTDIKPGIGRGEAQVFQPVQAPQQDTASIQRAYAQKEASKRAEAKAVAKAKAEAKKAKKEDEEKYKIEFDYKGIPLGSTPDVITGSTAFMDWTRENIDDIRANNDNMGTIWQSKYTSWKAGLDMLREGNKEAGDWNNLINTLDMGADGLNNAVVLENMDNPAYFSELATGDWQTFGSKFSAEMGSISEKAKDVDVIGLSQDAAKVDPPTGRLRSRKDPKTGDNVYERSVDEVKWRKEMDVSADAMWNNNAAIRSVYEPKNPGDKYNKAWRELVWTNRDKTTPAAQVRKGEDEEGGITFNIGGGSAGGYDYNRKEGTLPLRTLSEAEKHLIEKGYTPKDKEEPINWVEYELSKEGKTITQEVMLADPKDPTGKKRIKAKVFAYRKEGNGKWRVMYEYTQKYIEDNKEKTGKFQDSILLKDVAGKIDKSYDMTEEILNDWERREREAAGTATPGTSSGTTPSFQ